MLVIREEQLQAMVEKRKEVSLARRAELLIKALRDTGAMDIESPDFRRILGEYRRRNRSLHQYIGEDDAICLRALVEAKLTEAADHGLRTDLVVMHFVGYTFQYGLDWSSQEPIKRILNDSESDEVKKINTLGRVLPRLHYS